MVFSPAQVSDYNLPSRIDLGLLMPPAKVRADHEQKPSLARNLVTNLLRFVD